MSISTFSGSTFSICVTPQESDLNEAAFELLAMIPVSNVITYPEASITEAIIEQLFIDTVGVMPARKGSKTGDESNIEMGYNSEDAGQVALVAVATTKFAHAFKMELDDKPSGGATNTIVWGRALFPISKIGSGGADDFVPLNVTMKVQQLLTIPAT